MTRPVERPSANEARPSVGLSIDLTRLTVEELLGFSRAILRELRRRGVIRTANAPAGDYAELLVQRATNGELAPNSQKSWDVLADNGERLQVKGRVLIENGSREVSAFRSWDFDAAVIVLFDDDFRVWRAAHVPLDEVRSVARFYEHVGGYRVIATDRLLSSGEDWTERLQAVVE